MNPRDSAVILGISINYKPLVLRIPINPTTGGPKSPISTVSGLMILDHFDHYHFYI